MWAQQEEVYQRNLKEVASKLEESENLLDRERSVLRGLVAENESLMENVKRLELAMSEERSCRQTIEKVSRQHQCEADEKQKKIQELILEIHRIQSEMKLKAEKSQGDIRKKERLLQIKTKELNHKSDLCASLKSQLDDITGTHEQLTRDLNDLRSSCSSNRKCVGRLCLKMLGKSYRGVEEMPSNDTILQELQQCCSAMKEKDQLILQLERDRRELESQLSERKRALDSSDRNILKVHTEMDAVRQEMNEVSSKISFSEETIAVQNHELEALKRKLNQTDNENKTLRKIYEESEQVFKQYLISLGKKLSQCLSTGSSVLGEETLLQTQNELSNMFDQVVAEHHAIHSETERLQEQVRTADLHWGMKLKEVIHRQRAKVGLLRDKLKNQKEKESKLCDKLRSVSVAKEILVSRTQKMRDTACLLTHENTTLQCLLILSHGALFGSLVQIQQLVVGKSLILKHLHYMQQFQDETRAFVCSLRKDVMQLRPISKFRSVVIAIVAVQRWTRSKPTASLRCRLLSGSGISLKHLCVLLPGGLLLDGKSPFAPDTRTTVMEDLRPAMTAISACIEGDSLLTNCNDLLKTFSQSLTAEAPVFCEGVKWDLSNACGLRKMSKSHRPCDDCQVSTGQEIGTSLRSTFEHLLQDLHSVKQEHRKVELLIEQMTMERKELLSKTQHLDAIKLKVELLQKELNTMISPSVHKLVEDELQKALQREAEEQDVVNTQAQHLEALKARLTLSQQELAERSSALDEAIQNVAGLRTKMASKEQTIKYLERSGVGATKEKRRTEKQLKSLKQTVEDLNSDKMCLLEFITQFRMSLVKMDNDVSVLEKHMSEGDFCPLSIEFPPKMMAVSKFPMCQDLQEVAHKVLVHAATRISSLQSKLAMCEVHVQSLRQELQEVYIRTQEQSLLED
jgi:chromosome segregation ATPase